MAAVQQAFTFNINHAHPISIARDTAFRSPVRLGLGHALRKTHNTTRARSAAADKLPAPK